jgi:hypothetical protein
MNRYVSLLGLQKGKQKSATDILGRKRDWSRFSTTENSPQQRCRHPGFATIARHNIRCCFSVLYVVSRTVSTEIVHSFTIPQIDRASNSGEIGALAYPQRED